jgi:integrase
MILPSHSSSEAEPCGKGKRPKPQRWPFVNKRVYPSGAIGWTVDARTKTGGERKSFGTRQAAETFAEQCRVRRENQGLAAFGNEELARFGKTVQDAISFYLEHLRQSEHSIPVKQAAIELLQARRAAGISEAYCRQLEGKLCRFAETFGERLVEAISTKELDEWLAALQVGPYTRNTFRRDLRTMFSFCLKRGYASKNPATATETAKLVDQPAGILKVSEAAKLLNSCTPNALPYVAVGLFAGIRAAELHKLDWSEVDLEAGLIEIKAHKAKTARRRLVKIEPVLKAWLKSETERRGPLVTPGCLAEVKKAARAAGFGRPGTETPEEKKAGIKLHPWPSNALRHSFGSYWLAKHQDVAALSLQMGNSPAIVFGHYRELVRPAEAERFWDLMPSGPGAKVISFDLPAACTPDAGGSGEEAESAA